MARPVLLLNRFCPLLSLGGQENLVIYKIERLLVLQSPDQTTEPGSSNAIGLDGLDLGIWG